MAQKSTFRIIIEPIAIAIALALVVRHAFFRIYAIPSASMAPTLRIGDHIIVTPYRPDDRPERGDVIVFRSTTGADEFLVKRVIATPGDLIDSRDGMVRIGGHAISEPYLLDPASTGAISPQIVAGDCYFVMGDNRASSFDSRSWGAVPRALIAGRARMILWSGDGRSTPTAHAAIRGRAMTPATASSWRIFRPIE